MKVRDAMVTGAVTARPGDSVRSVVQKMVMRHCGAIPIVDADDRLMGIISVRDIILPLFAKPDEVYQEDVHAMNFEEMERGYGEVLGKKAEAIMTRNPLVVSPEDEVLKAASVMGLKNLRRIPVAEDGRLLGMISIGDINRILFMGQFEPLRAVG